MKLNIWAFGIAVGTVIASAFTICAFFVAVAPQATADFIGYLLHINLTGLTRAISWGSYVAGVLAVGIWAAFWASVAAKFYNFLIAR